MKTLNEYSAEQRESELNKRKQIAKAFADWADQLDKDHPTTNNHAFRIREHFRSLNNGFNWNQPAKLGVACDDCGCELVDYRHQMLMSNPPKRHADCPQCGKHGYMRY